MAGEENAPAEGQVSTPTEGNPESTPVDIPEVSSEAPTGGAPEGQGGDTPKNPGESPSTSEAPETASAETQELYYAGQQVNVEIPDEVNESLKSAGVDANKVLGELYAKDGDFTLSDETRAPLDEKYGKPMVDTFLRALKAQNDSTLKGAEDAVRQAEEANKQAVEWSNELVGGEENWTALETWSEDNLSDAEVESFNKAMESADPWIQELAIKSLIGKMQESEGDQSASLISGDAPDREAGAPLSRQDYINEMTSKSFMELKGPERDAAQRKLDARRQAGIKRGL